jgi:hypothetical protein
MFDNTLNSEIDNIFEELPVIIDSISFKRLDSLRIDDFYKNFFRQELIWRVYGSFSELKNHKNFSYDINDFELLFQDYTSALLKHAVIRTDEFNELITLAAKYRLHFLCKPVDTLINFVYVDCYSKPMVDLFIKTNFFQEYSFIIEAFADFFRINNLYSYSHEIVFKVDFEKHIKDYVVKYFSKIDSNYFSEIIKPLFNFFSTDKNDLTVPVIALVMFLNDCGLKEFADYLYNNCEPESTLSIRQFLELLSGSLNLALSKQEYSEKAENEDEIDQDIEILQNVVNPNLIEEIKEVNYEQIEPDIIKNVEVQDFNDVKLDVETNINSKDFEKVKIILDKKLELSNVSDPNIKLLNLDEINEKIYDDETKITPQSINFDLKYSIRKTVNDIYKSMK